MLAQTSFQLKPQTLFDEQNWFQSSSVKIEFLKIIHLPIGQIKNKIN